MEQQYGILVEIGIMKQSTKKDEVFNVKSDSNTSRIRSTYIIVVDMDTEHGMEELGLVMPHDFIHLSWKRSFRLSNAFQSHSDSCRVVVKCVLVDCRDVDGRVSSEM